MSQEMPGKSEAMPFPDARMLNDGGFTTPQGTLVQTNYVDLSGALPLGGLTLVKASERRFDLRTKGTIRLSRPGVFRTTGEVLVKDDQEGQARTETRDTVEEQEGQTELARRVRALGAAMRLCHTKMSVSATEKATRTNTTSANVTFGRDWLIYSTSILPDEDEEEAWRQTFSDNYTSVARIYRPTQFAQALGFAICEHVGATGKPAPTSVTFHGFKTVKVERTSQMVLHGPVLYVDDPYRCIEDAKEGWPQICSMIFVKSRTHAAQKEYRFATLSIREEVGDVVDVPVSGMMRDCLERVNTPVVATEAQVAIVEDSAETPGNRETSHGYSYRRCIVKHQSEKWSEDEESKGRKREEIVEEAVTSPEELPEPFPTEQKQPDVIIFHQVGNQCSLQYHAHRNEETERWRIETLRENPAIAENPRLGKLPEGLEVPDDVWFDSTEVPPMPPEFILDLCLNPSAPRPPMEYSPLARFSAAEVEHAMACYRSLGMAVNLLKGVEQERATASAWNAFGFVLDLVSRFGAIVKSMCVIKECVAVVELERAPLTGAVAWATFSGTGTYTLYIDRGNVEELVFPGQFSRTGPISETTLVETLRDNGWPLKDPEDRENIDGNRGASEANAGAGEDGLKGKGRTASDVNRQNERFWATPMAQALDTRKSISLMARDLKRARRCLGIGKAEAAERAGLSVADYVRIERGRVPRSEGGIGTIMGVARSLGAGALRMEYLKPHRTYLRVELSDDRLLMMFLDRVSTDISRSRAEGYYVSPYNVLELVEEIGLETVLESRSTSDRALFSLWLTAVLVLSLRKSKEKRYVRLGRESVDQTEILTVDLLGGEIDTEKVEVAHHDSDFGDIYETLVAMFDRRRAEKRMTVVYASGNVNVANLHKLMRAYKGQAAYVVTGTRDGKGARVIPCGQARSDRREEPWPEMTVDLSGSLPARYEYDGVACVGTVGPGGSLLPVFIKEVALSSIAGGRALHRIWRSSFRWLQRRAPPRS